MKRCEFVLLNLNISHLAFAQEAENDGAVDGAGERLCCFRGVSQATRVSTLVVEVAM
jgi:hypothetical protein